MTPEWIQIAFALFVLIWCLRIESSYVTLPIEYSSIFLQLLLSPFAIFMSMRKVDLPSPSLKTGVASFVPSSFSELNTGVVRPHFHSSSNGVHCSRTPACAEKDVKKSGHQFHSGNLYLVLYINKYTKIHIFNLRRMMWRYDWSWQLLTIFYVRI